MAGKPLHWAWGWLYRTVQDMGAAGTYTIEFEEEPDGRIVPRKVTRVREVRLRPEQ